MLLLTIFVIIPLIETFLFLIVGQAIGVMPTFLLCVLTAGIGGFLVRTQGLQTLFSAKTALSRNQLPIGQLFDGLCVTMAGVLLITPGFFTDTLGLLLLVPEVRLRLRDYLAKKFDIQATGYDSYTIEGEFTQLENHDDNNP